jgi:predicted nucleic-acid-binding protein
LLGLQNATFLHRDIVDVAMAAFRRGCDFADALHAASAPSADAFLTFDKAFVQRAAALDGLPPVRLLETEAPLNE